MEPESVLIVATVFVFINTGIIMCAELFRDSTEDNIVRDTISRIICPSNLVVSVLAMIGAQKRKSLLLLPFLSTLALFMLFMGLGLVYIATYCPYQLAKGETNFLCSMGIIFGATCIAGLLFGTCQSYIVISLFKFLRRDPSEDLNDATEMEVMEKLDDTAGPSTSY